MTYFWKINTFLKGEQSVVVKCSDSFLYWIQCSVWLLEVYITNLLEQDIHHHLSEFLAHEKAARGENQPNAQGKWNLSAWFPLLPEDLPKRLDSEEDYLDTSTPCFHSPGQTRWICAPSAERSQNIHVSTMAVAAMDTWMGLPEQGPALRSQMSARLVT